MSHTGASPMSDGPNTLDRMRDAYTSPTALVYYALAVAVLIGLALGYHWSVTADLREALAALEACKAGGS